ncbi:hypothetical protein PIROE2DRAFT_66732, partial [Piromyces sp. E2]
EISNNSDSVSGNLNVNNLSVNNLGVNRSSINKSNRKCSKIYHFLTKIAAFFNTIIPIVSGQRWSVIRKYSIKITKSTNADNTVKQASSTNDPISAYAHATERNRNSLSGSQTQ